VAGNVTATIYWSPSVGTGGNVVWDLINTSLQAGSLVTDATDETDTTTSAAGGTAEALILTSAITVSTLLSASFQRIVVQRQATHASDTLAGDAWFLGLHLVRA